MRANKASQVPPTMRKRFEPVGGVSIPVASGEWVAVFQDEIKLPVVAFDNAGNALVINDEWGALVRANVYDDFVRVDLTSTAAAAAYPMGVAS